MMEMWIAAAGWAAAVFLAGLLVGKESAGGRLRRRRRTQRRERPLEAEEEEVPAFWMTPDTLTRYCTSSKVTGA